MVGNGCWPLALYRRVHWLRSQFAISWFATKNPLDELVMIIKDLTLDDLGALML